MPAHTFQIAIREGEDWLREYVCAEDKYSAVEEFIEQNPLLSLEFLLQVDELEVERCD